MASPLLTKHEALKLHEFYKIRAMANSINKILLASHNKGKIAQLHAMLNPLGFEVVSADEVNLPETVEDQTTFKGNAEKKAYEAFLATGIPALADDSGLCVDALDGKPGVFTARYSRTYERLLTEIAHVPSEQRQAHFICVLALVLPNQPTIFFEGRMDGTITQEPRGQSGFGYDPVFVPESHTKTFAEMPDEDRNVLSHRGRAFQQLYTYLKHHG